MGIKTSLEGLHGHAREIDEKDRQLGGLLSKFAELPAMLQEQFIKEVGEIREMAGKNEKAALDMIRERAEFYDMVLEENQEEAKKPPEQRKPLTATIEEIAGKFDRFYRFDKPKKPREEPVN